MLMSIFEGISAIGLVGRVMVISIISVFFPLTALSFFSYMIPKKEKDYKEALDKMDIDYESSRKVSDIFSRSRFFLPVGFAFFICFFAISYFAFADKFLEDIQDSVILSGAHFGTGNKVLIAQSISVLAFAFLGGFIWSATNILHRLISNDLTPSVYYSAGIRILMASVIALVLSFMLGEESGPEFLGFSASLSAIAFLTGMFPERVLQYLIKVFQKFVNPDNFKTNHLSLYQIQGISMQHKERLEEIGIENAQNLSTASFTQLLIETPFKSRQLLDWIGQAKLLCYAEADIGKLRAIGIRSVFDFFSKNKSPESLQQMAEDLEIKDLLLQNLYHQIHGDMGIIKLYEYLTQCNSPDKKD